MLSSLCIQLPQTPLLLLLSTGTGCSRCRGRPFCKKNLFSFDITHDAEQIHHMHKIITTKIFLSLWMFGGLRKILDSNVVIIHYLSTSVLRWRKPIIDWGKTLRLTGIYCIWPLQPDVGTRYWCNQKASDQSMRICKVGHIWKMRHDMSNMFYVE